jgi:hypothetical protein
MFPNTLKCFKYKSERGKRHSYLIWSLSELKESNDASLSTMPGCTICSINFNVLHSLGLIPTLEWRNREECRSAGYQHDHQSASTGPLSYPVIQIKKLLLTELAIVSPKMSSPKTAISNPWNS